MALINPPLLVSGGTHEARTFRMMVRDSVGGAEGVTQGDDLRVKALAVPGAAVSVADGSGMIQGRAVAHQGTYAAYNAGEATVPIAPTGATPRSDLLVLRVEDPEYEGTLNPATDQVAYFHVISAVTSTPWGVILPPGVSLRATGQFPALSGMSAIALALIQIPANTSVITAGMIRDVRNIAKPRQLRSLQSTSPADEEDFPTSANNVWRAWPPSAEWGVWVPEWAVRARVLLHIYGLQINAGSFYGGFAFQLGSVRGQSVGIDTATADAGKRSTVATADTIDIPAAMRGSWQDVTSQLARWTQTAGIPQADVATTCTVDIEFEEDIR